MTALLMLLMRGVQYAASLLWSAIFISSVHASNLQVSPVLIELQAQQRADGLWLSNSGNAVLTAQLRVFRWSQRDGADVLLPTADLVTSPAMVSIAPGKPQLVRIVRVNNALVASAQEQSFRIILDEIPDLAGARGVQFALRYSIPVFVAATGGTVGPALDWGIRKAGNELLLRVTNTGNERAQITDVSFKSNNGRTTVVTKGLYGYALAKNTREWELKQYGSVFAGGGVLSAKVNQSTVNIHLPAVP